jgi:hypothetical protein
VPAGADELSLDLASNETATLEVRHGELPTGFIQDRFVGYRDGHAKATIPQPAAGDWFIRVDAFIHGAPDGQLTATLK